jgi:hypothetical protein
MFDGAELSAVYGSTPYDQPTMQKMQQPIPQPTQQPQQIGVNPHVADVNSYGKDTSSHATPPDVQYAPPNAMYAQQMPHPKSYAGGDTFWEKIGNKKMEIVKMIVLSLVIVLGLSLDRVAGFYLDDYITKSIFTNLQELLVRVSYPVGIILVMWIIKASM